MFTSMAAKLFRCFAKPRRARTRGPALRRLGFEDLEGRRVLSGAAAFAIMGLPTANLAGVPEEFVLIAIDAAKQKVLAYTGTVTFTTNDLKAALPQSYTFTGNDAGRHTFTVTFRTAGKRTLSVTDAADKLGGTFTSTVAPGALARFSIKGLAPATAGTPQNVVITAVDAYGNTETGFTGTVSFNSNDIGAALPPNYTFVAADHGTHKFRVTLNTPGLDFVGVADAVATSLVKGREVVLISRA